MKVQKAPTTPREFFNAGTEQLRAGQLREAESYLESVLLSQNSQFQPPALFNLGHVRFAQGAEALKKSPPGSATADSAQIAGQNGAGAVKAIDDVLASDDIQRLVAAYINGRGHQRQLKAAAEAVKQALQQHGVALNKWERASSDFKSALELNPSDEEARKNADIVDRNIAKLVDMIQRLQQMAAMLGQQSKQLGEKLKQLKGKIPGKQMPPGAAGEDEEDEDFPFGKEPGQKEGATKEGKEVNMSPEQAGWLLESFRLDGERKLPMGPESPAIPKRERNRPGEMLTKTPSRNLTAKAQAALALLCFAALAPSCLAQNPPPQQDPYLTLMMSQPRLDANGPVDPTASFDPPVVKPGEESIYRVTLKALEQTINWPEKIPAPKELSLRPGAHGQTFQMAGPAVMTPLTDFNTHVRTTVEGEFTLPEFTLKVGDKTVTIPAAKLVVSSAPTSAPPSFNLLMELNRKEVFVGEPVAVRVMLQGPPGTFQALQQPQITGKGFMWTKERCASKWAALPAAGMACSTFMKRWSPPSKRDGSVCLRKGSSVAIGCPAIL